MAPRITPMFIFVTGFRGRARGRGRGWGGPGSEIWGDGYFGDGGRFSPRGNRRGWGRHRGRPY